MQKFLLFIITLSLFGCGSMVDINYSPTVVDYTNPAIDKENEALIGEELLVQTKLNRFEGILVRETIEVGVVGVWAYQILPGYYQKAGEDQSVIAYVPAEQGNSGKIIISTFASMWRGIQVSKRNNDICVITLQNAADCALSSDASEKFEKVTFDQPLQSSTNKSLVYFGSKGDIVKLGYIESKPNEHGPNRSVSDFDISASKIINFQGARIEVLEINESSLRYKVLKNFS